MSWKTLNCSVELSWPVSWCLSEGSLHCSVIHGSYKVLIKAKKSESLLSVSSSLYLPYCFISSPPFSCVCLLKDKKKQELVKKLRYFLPQTYPSFLLQSLCPTKLFSLTDFQGYCKALYYRMRRCVCVFVCEREWWWSWAWLFVSSDVKCLMTSDVFLYFL